MENSTGTVSDQPPRRGVGRFLLDSFSETVLSFVFFLLRFAVWCMQWSVALVVFLLVMAGAGYFVYTVALEGGQHVSVPDVVDMPITDAAFLLTEKGLELGRQSPVSHPTAPKFYIIAQRPGSGRVVREGRAVNVVVSMGQDYLHAPDIIGKTLEEARREISAARFRVGSLARIADDAPRDTVLSQDPPAGGELAEQEEIHLLLSAGSGTPNALMPDLRDMPVSEVEAALADFGVVLVAREVDIPDAALDVVLAQSPAPDTLIYQGQTVTYDYKPSVPGEAPSMRYEATVRHQMFYDWFGREVRVDVIDRMGNRQKVYAKEPMFDDAARATYVSGAAIRVPVTYVVEATVEVYIDGNLEASYSLKEGNAPVKVN